MRVVAGVDIDPQALERCKEWYGPEFFGTKDYCQMLGKADIDAVFVTSPDFLHEEHAVAALQAGKHVYLEKPMAITIEGCDRILRTAYERGVKLYCGHNMRHMAFTRKMREIVVSGAIGEVKTAWCRHFVCYGGDAYFKDWHAERRYSTSLLLQKGAHDIDLLHWLCGGYTQRVTAMGNLTVYNQITDKRKPGEKTASGWNPDNWPPLSLKGMNPIIDVEDLSMMLMNLDNGVLCSLPAMPLRPGRLAELHGHRHGGADRELLRLPRAHGRAAVEHAVPLQPLRRRTVLRGHDLGRQPRRGG